MNRDGKPLVYLILGAAGSERRDVLADLIEGGLTTEDKPAVLVSRGEVATDDSPKLPRLALWSREGETIDAELPQDASHVFFLTDGRDSPIDQIEAFKPWLEAQGGELAGVICVVNCQFLEKHPDLLPWYEACIFFSDVVLLTRRDGVANKWLSDFAGHFQKLFYPCLFELVKGGRVKNPALVLDGQPRRMSHYFEEEQEWIVTNEDGEEIDEDDESSGEDEEEVHAAPEEDPYLVKDSAGRRQKRIPDISKYLS
jgi:hypothetical protein